MPTQVKRQKKYFNNQLAQLMMLHSYQKAYNDSILTDFIE